MANHESATPRGAPTRSAGTRGFLRRAVRAVRIVSRDGRIPRPVRWGGAAGLLPMPGPVDEIILLLVGAVLWLFYREQLREAWGRAAEESRRGAP